MIIVPTIGQTSWGDELNDALSELALSGFNPTDHGLVAWNYDPSQGSASGAPVSGTVRMVRMPAIVQPTTVNGVALHVATGSVTPVAGQNFVGLYDSAGTRVAVSAAITTQFNTSDADAIVPFTAPYVAAAGVYYAAVLVVAATPAAFTASSNAGSDGNFNLTAATGRFTNGPAAQTSLPASIVMASRTLSAQSTWAGLS